MTAEIATIEPEARSEPTKIVVRGQGLPVGGRRPEAEYSKDDSYSRS